MRTNRVPGIVRLVLATLKSAVIFLPVPIIMVAKGKRKRRKCVAEQMEDLESMQQETLTALELSDQRRERKLFDLYRRGLATRGDTSDQAAAPLGLRVGDSQIEGAGRGVFATRDFVKNEPVFLSAPTIADATRMTADQLRYSYNVDTVAGKPYKGFESVVYDYSDARSADLVRYINSDRANTDKTYNVTLVSRRGVIVVLACRKIRAGDELLNFYLLPPEDSDFGARTAPPKETSAAHVDAGSGGPHVHGGAKGTSAASEPTDPEPEPWSMVQDRMPGGFFKQDISPNVKRGTNCFQEE